jgi:soluble lytic murein transglycosylase-like protein
VKTIIMLLLAAILAVPAWAQPWPQTAPRIGNLFLKKEYWDYMKEAAQRYQISPFLIEAVCAIESRFDPDASSGRGRCFGLMQLERGTAKKYGVDAHDPRQNILGGAAVLARLMHEYHGDISRVLHFYNAACTPDYVYQVILAYNQALRCESQTPTQTRICKTSALSGRFRD